MSDGSDSSSSNDSVAIESPPPSAQPATQHEDDPRARLHRLAMQLIRTQNRRLLVEFLTLRRAMR
ncbi:MAG: hypothetical protein H7Z14_10160 [Anaerolineae bacterium]|nr:hypothetical protein [Phycisphaerae bacterium]